MEENKTKQQNKLYFEDLDHLFVPSGSISTFCSFNFNIHYDELSSHNHFSGKGTRSIVSYCLRNVCSM